MRLALGQASHVLGRWFLVMDPRGVDVSQEVKSQGTCPWPSGQHSGEW